jgi:hypothetical protein
MVRKMIHILTGWARSLGLLSTADPLKKLSELRLKLCGECDFSRSSTTLEIINGTMKKESGLFCTKCHCPCKQKSLVLDETCPIKRW